MLCKKTDVFILIFYKKFANLLTISNILFRTILLTVYHIACQHKIIKKIKNQTNIQDQHKNANTI